MQIEVDIKWTKSEMERKIPYIDYIENLKYDSNEPTYERETKPQTQRIDCGCQGEQWERWIGNSGLAEANLNRYSYIEWINNKSYCIAQGTIVNIQW